MTTPLVGVAIVNYDRRESTLRAVKSIQQDGRESVRIAVIENSTEPAERVDEGAGVVLVETGGNVGFAAGANAGLRLLFAGGMDLVLLLNDDARVEPGCIDALAASFRRTPDAGLVAPLVLRADGRIETAGIRIGRLSGRHRLLLHGRPRESAGAFRGTWAVAGTALMISRSCFEATGGFDESFFCYFEDVDLCLRARQLGFETFLAPAACVRHDKAGVTDMEIYYSCRNHLRLLQRHLPLRRGARLRTLATAAAYALYGLRRGRLFRLSLWRAIGKALRDSRGF